MEVRNNKCINKILDNFNQKTFVIARLYHYKLDLHFLKNQKNSLVIFNILKFYTKLRLRNKSSSRCLII